MPSILSLGDYVVYWIGLGVCTVGAFGYAAYQALRRRGGK
jgi:hypothetical protein